MGAYCLRSAYAVFEQVLTPKIKTRKLLFYFDFFTHPFALPDLTSAFGAICPGYPKCTLGHAMTLHCLEIHGQFGFSRRNLYPKLRSDFHPPASVVLPWRQPALQGGNA